MRMKLLAIETSCDETAIAVTEGLHVLSSVKVTQEIHAQWGGVVPSLAKRDHEQNIDWVLQKALADAGVTMSDIEVIGVTMGPGLAIALGVGIAKAKALAKEFDLPLVAVNHVEGHILSSLIQKDSLAVQPDVHFPALAMVISGGHTQLILVERVGTYRIVAESLDDDIGEALDKGARLLGLPYPGGPALEQLARRGVAGTYPLPLPMQGQEHNRFSYAGLKAAFSRLVQSLQTTSELSDQQKSDLAACYQEMVFTHLLRITSRVIDDLEVSVSDLLVGGGVVANSTLRGRLGELATTKGLQVRYPEQMVLCTDNAAMIGIAAGFKAERKEFTPAEAIDRRPRWRVDEL